MDLLLVVKLQAVLDGPQEPVRVGELLRIVAVDVAGVGKLAECDERGRRAELRIGPAVDQLQQLDRELDVADATRTEFELTVGQSSAGHVRFGADLHGPNLSDRLRRERAAPKPRRRRLVEGVAEYAVAPDTARFHERLELPRLRPAFPVGLIRRNGAHERTVATLRPQIQIDA